MKKIITFFVFFNILIFNVNAIEINSKNAVLYNLNDNNIIYEKDSNQKVQVASLTKIVTAITIIDNVEDLNKEITINSKMLEGLNGYAKAGLKIGDKVTYLDLLYALMLPSGADAALALAISYSDNLDLFVEEMNKEVKKIGTTDSNFSNPIGIDDTNNYSTSLDIAKIVKYALKNDTFKIIFQADKYTIKSIDLKLTKTTMSKAKSYNLDVSDINGSKTGYTTLAGYCLVSTASINNVNYLLVTLNADTSYPYHISDAVDLYKFYSTNYSYKTVIKANKVIRTIPIKHSSQKVFKVIPDRDIKLYLSNDYDLNKLVYEYKGLEYITSKNKINDKIGVINVKYDDKPIYTYNVCLKDNIKYYNYPLYIVIIICFIIFIRICYNKIIKRKKRRR